jgi:Holliday junction resolvase RusA-like endonuclease
MIYTDPVAKARARTVVNNGKVHSFTPDKTAVSENVIRYEIAQHYKEPPFPAKTPLALVVVFYCAKPVSKPKKSLYPVCKPDTDNYIKTLLDAGNKFLWYDDSQIVSITALKIYGTPPRIELRLQEITEILRSE